MEWTSGDIHRFNTDAAALRGVARSKKWGGQYGLGVGRDIPSQVWGYGLGYKLKLISTLHNDSIPETPSGKKGVDVSTPVHLVATLLVMTLKYVTQATMRLNYLTQRHCISAG